MGPYTSAVDLPRARVDLELGRRRHRRITGPAGLLLFVCLFLPAVKGCGEPVYPATMPMFWHPYLYGLVLALGTARATVRSLRHTVVALRILAWLTIVGGAMLLVVAGPLGLAELFLGAVLLVVIGRRGCGASPGSAGARSTAYAVRSKIERRVALTAVVVGALSLLWFGLWSATPDALVGVYVSVLASAGLLVGGLVWLGESSRVL